MVNKLKTSRNVLDNKLYEQIKAFERDDPEVLSTNSTRLFKKVIEENFVLIGSFFFYYEIMYMFPDHSCDLAMTDSWQSNTVALAMQNNSAYKRYVNEFTTDFAEFGITQKLADESFPNVSCTRDSVQATHKPVLFELFISVFYVLFGLMFLSVIVLAYEVGFLNMFHKNTT